MNKFRHIFRMILALGLVASFYMSVLHVLLWRRPIHQAAARGDIAALKRHLAKGANLNQDARWPHAGTPLLYAARAGRIKTVRFLLSLGADANAQSVWSATPLMQAARQGHAEIARLLLKHGADPNRAELDNGQTALMWAARAGRRQIVRLLLDAGADTQSLSYSRQSALDFARQSGDAEIVRMLEDAAGG